MSTFSLSPRECGNHLLSLLPDDDLAALAPHLELVDLKFEQVIAERGQPLSHVYFPCSTVLSVHGQMNDGRVVEVGTIGNEGFYGIDVLLGGGEQARARKTTLCQIPGKALRLPATEFLQSRTSLRSVALRYISFYLSQMQQSVTCNRLHSVKERFAYWLLMSHDRVAEDSFCLTQESVANTLGVHRPTVSVVAVSFQHAGMIRYSRGQITITSRQALEDASCECYGIAQQQFESHMGPFRKECRYEDADI